MSLEIVVISPHFVRVNAALRDPKVVWLDVLVLEVEHGQAEQALLAVAKTLLLAVGSLGPPALEEAVLAVFAHVHELGVDAPPARDVEENLVGTRHAQRCPSMPLAP